MIEDIDWGAQKKEYKKEGQITYPHPDYEKNIADIVDFMQRMLEFMLPGMDISFAGSPGMEDSILWITLQKGSSIPIGAYDYPLVIHQQNATLKCELMASFKAIYELAKRHLEEKALDPDDHQTHETEK